MLSVKLVVVGGEAKSKEVQLNLPTVIGRGRGKDGVTLTLPHKLVSRKHTELYEQDGKLFVKDLGSLNGTFVNNKRIVQRTALEPNELLTLGDVTFRAVYDIQGVTDAPEMPEFQEVKPDVLEEETETKSESGSDTDKSFVDINPADIDDEEADAALAGASAVGVEPDAVEPVEEAEPIRSPVVTPAASISAAGSSDIFSGPQIEGATPDKSICVNALDSLPTANKTSDFSVQLDGVERPESIKKVEIELDEPVVKEASEDSRLGSFLKKMPR
jgi:predicted component of type VI protein secretion system